MKRRMWLMVALLMLLPMALMMSACAKSGVSSATQAEQAALDAERDRQEELERPHGSGPWRRSASSRSSCSPSRRWTPSAAVS